jgi:hypothetical protein
VALAGVIAPYQIAEPFAYAADTGVSVCVVSKRTPVSTSVGTKAVLRDVLVSVTVRVVPVRLKSAEADRLPLEPL